METPVRLTREGEIALIAIDNPPVNAAGQAVRAGLMEALREADADQAVRAIVIFGAGRTFIAGADIREFGKPPQPPSLPEVVEAIEAAEKPVVAALHGTALGGGLEVAMAAHYRVALASARFGLPEVTLGILPGAGGTQRLPRLIPFEKAAEMITSGAMIGAREARELGLIDEIAEGEDVRAAGLGHARRLLAEGAGPRRTGERPVNRPEPEVLEALRARVAQKAGGRIAPPTALRALEAALARPLRAGLAEERRLFTELLNSDQRAALVHVFFAERAVAKLPELEGVAPRGFDRLGVVGGGTMGAGIATAALLAGLDVTLAERDDAAAETARETVARNLDGAARRGKLSEAARETILSDRFRAAGDLGAMADRDLVIEAVFEDLGVKREVFARLDAVCREGAVLATNTSYLDVAEIAAATARPQDVIGLHFFSPAHVMKLLEVVVPPGTANDVIATGFALAKRLKKIPVRAGICDGFIGNRIMNHYQKANFASVLAGATPQQVDRALEGFGLAMGPFAVGDLAGLDIGWANRKRQAPRRDPRERYAAFADRLCERGQFGRKTGRGFYIYEEGKAPVPNPEALAIIEAERAEKGITPRALSDEEIVARYLAAMVNEGARVVEEGIARRPADVDVVMINGYGFPRWRGGPMHHADAMVLGRILADIERFAEEDDVFWQPAPLLRQLVAEGRDFASLNG